MKPNDLNIIDYQNVVKAFHDETDRAAAVLAGSFMESYLAKYLRSYMVDDPKVDQLFDGFGPFADFKKRIECGYAFGVINEQYRNDLNFIRKICNHFAHHPLEARFDKSPVNQWCKNLSTNKLYPLKGQEANKNNDNRSRYLVAIGLCVGTWHNSMLKRKSQKNA